MHLFCGVLEMALWNSFWSEILAVATGFSRGFVVTLVQVRWHMDSTFGLSVEFYSSSFGTVLLKHHKAENTFPIICQMLFVSSRICKHHVPVCFGRDIKSCKETLINKRNTEQGTLWLNRTHQRKVWSRVNDKYIHKCSTFWRRYRILTSILMDLIQLECVSRIITFYSPFNSSV